MTSPTKSSYDVAGRAARVPPTRMGPRAARHLAREHHARRCASLRARARQALAARRRRMRARRRSTARVTQGRRRFTALDDAGSAQLIGWDGRSTSAPSAAMLTRASSRASTRRLSPARASAQQLAGHPRDACSRPARRSTFRVLVSCSARSSAMRRAPGWVKRWRPGNDLPRLALRRRLRHPVRCRFRG